MMQIAKLLFCSVSAIAGLTLGFVTAPAIAAPAANQVGSGVRTGFQDDTSFVINGKFKVSDFGDVTLSGRPTVLLNDELELRLAVTGESEIAQNLSPFIGGGISINTDGLGDSDPLLTFGVDYRLDQQFGVQLGGNVLFKPNDTDTEFMVTANYIF